MNYCIPTNRSMCITKKIERKERSEYSKKLRDFFESHDISVHVDRNTETASMIVKEK